MISRYSTICNVVDKAECIAGEQVRMLPQQHCLHPSLCLSHRLRDFRDFRGLPREENAVKEKTERRDPIEKDKEIERERESDSSLQGRSETMRASIDPLSFLSCRVELTLPRSPFSIVAVVLVDARNLPRARNFSATVPACRRSLN